MTFLELCRRAVLEASIAGGGTLPASVSGPQTLQISRMINWVADAWRELQGQDTWTWQWQAATLTVVADTNSVAQQIAPVRWDKDATFMGSQQLDFWPWEQFRQVYPVSRIVPGQPSAWSIRPDLAFVVNTQPTVDTAIAVERYTNPTELVADGDVPAMPADLHMYLVWSAVMKYAARDEAGSLYSTSEKFANDIKASIMERCLPQISLGGSLC